MCTSSLVTATPHEPPLALPAISLTVFGRLSDYLPPPHGPTWTSNGTLRYRQSTLSSSPRTDDVMVYQTSAATSGLYSVVLTAIDRDSSVSLFTSTAPDIDDVTATMMTPLPVGPVTAADDYTITWDVSATREVNECCLC